MKRLLLIAAVLLCASTANAQWGGYAGGYQYNYRWNAYGFQSPGYFPPAANYGALASPYYYQPAPTYNVYMPPSAFTAGPLWRW